MGLPVNTPRWGNDQCTSGLQFNKAGYDQNRKYVVILCSEAVETKLVKLETSSTVILPPDGECSLVLISKTFWSIGLFLLFVKAESAALFQISALLSWGIGVGVGCCLSVWPEKIANSIKKVPKNYIIEKWYILTPLQKLPKNVGDLRKLIVAKGFKHLPKFQ